MAPLLELRNVGKIYVSEGNVAVGIRGVNLSLNKGEFVAVTGKSGSGKSTLLNVLSGMDTYEEGELLIEGEPTSHFMQKDWEDYRKKYISFIFQDYNILESFTVLQNVELALMHIENPIQRRAKAMELLRRVGLEKFIRHKGSKLSGGQKQRTVIARALAKDSPIILADEPTGNLDSQTSAEIIELLREVSKDKLVVVVTHNFEQVEACATRHIRIFDGAVEADTILASPNLSSDTKTESHEDTEPQSKWYDGIKAKWRTLRNGATLGRVRFFSMPKLSLFLCFLMILTSVSFTVVTSSNSETEALFQKETMFTHIDGRCVITRIDGKVMTKAELEKLTEDIDADSFEQYDYMLDSSISICLGEGWDAEYVSFKFGYDPSGYTLSGGRWAETDTEIVICVPLSYADDYGEGDQFQSFNLESDVMFNVSGYKVVGVCYFIDNTKDSVMLFTESGYRTASALAHFNQFSESYYNNNFSWHSNIYYSYPETGKDGKPTGKILKKNIATLESTSYNTNIVVDFGLEPGTYTFPNAFWDSLKKTGNYAFSSLSTDTVITGSFISYSYDYNDWYYGAYDYGTVGWMDSKYSQSQTVSCDLSSYTLVNEPSSLFNDGLYYDQSNVLIVSPDILCDFIYNDYYAESYTQASLFFSNDLKAHLKVNELRDLGYVAVPSDETVEADIYTRLTSILSLGMKLIGWVLSVIFISLFLGLCSSKAMNATKGDIAIMRSMGIPTPVVRMGIYMQVLCSLVPGLLATAVASYFVFTTPKTNGLFTFMHAKDYILVVILLVAIALRTAHNHVKKMFGESVKKTLRGGTK